MQILPSLIIHVPLAPIINSLVSSLTLYAFLWPIWQRCAALKQSNINVYLKHLCHSVCMYFSYGQHNTLDGSWRRFYKAPHREYEHHSSKRKDIPSLSASNTSYRISQRCQIVFCYMEFWYFPLIITNLFTERRQTLKKICISWTLQKQSSVKWGE